MKRLSWIIRVGPKCNRKCPYQMQTEGNLKTEENNNVMMEADVI